MRSKISALGRRLRSRATLQFKFSLSYILVIAAVLILLNSYPLLVSQNLMVSSTQANLRSTAKVIESALMGLEQLTEENVSAALSGLNEAGATRIMVTDSAGLVVYDTRQGNDAVGEYALYSVIASALKGSDTFYCRYDGEAFLSRMATPVVYHSQTVGAVYAYDYDTEQAALLQSFRSNLLTISVMIALLVTGLSIMLSCMLTRQISGLLQAIRNVREGAYSHRADASGTDEIAQIAAEFNSLTDRLQTTENARRRFVSDASHELKTPLTVVLSSAELLDQSALPEQKQYVDNIRAESRRMKRLVEDMLTLSRVERSGAHLPDAAADLSDIAADAALRFEPVAFEAGHTLSYDIAPDLTVRGDGEKLAQAVAVLLDNAIKYAAPHTEIRLDALRQGRNVCVQVENRGADIPADKLPHIFDRFYRADESRTGGDSFGLGLPIAKAIAEAHHGAIRCDSSGGITRFTITLPCQQGK